MWLCPAAVAHNVDPVYLLALCKAESDVGYGIDPRAERWGIGPDVSFGAYQFTLGFGFWADRSTDQTNLIAFRDYVVTHPTEVADYAAAWLSRELPAVGNEVLRAFVVYNSGGDNLDNPMWLAQWGANVQRYRDALAWAEQYRLA